MPSLLAVGGRAGGKAAAAMADVALRQSPPGTRAIVLIPYGHGLPNGVLPPEATVIEAGHPLPDAHGLQAAQTICAAVRELGEDDQLLALVSGGGSALLTLPLEGISLEDKRKVTQDLLYCGAPISQINCVRTHLSQVKGGRLAALAHPAQVVTLAFSDMPGDDIALIASGPTVADRTTLSLAMSLDGTAGIAALACDTDGIDGVGGHAGAMVDETTLRRAGVAGLSPAATLRENDSFRFFDALGDLVTTGPTRTNVNDFRVILVDE